MARSNIYVGLEIGTSKICVVVGEVRGDGSIKILGVGQAPSRGIRKGEIIDMDQAQTCLHDAIIRTEDRSDVIISNVVLAVTGSHIQSLNNTGLSRLPDEHNEITEEDLKEVKEISRAVTIPTENVFLHSIIRHYTVDGHEHVRNPVGLLGRQLEADFHIIHGIRSRIQNTIRCVRDLSLTVDDVVFSPVAAAQVVLNREAREQGALLIDIGGGTSDYVLYSNGVITASGCVAVGGDHISNDIAIVMKMPLTRAERLKIEEGEARLPDPPTHQTIHLEDDKGFAAREVDRDLLNEVIYCRVSEVMKKIRAQISATVDPRQVATGIYLTGGTSLLRGIDDVAHEVFDIPVCRPSTPPVSGLTSNFENPQFACPIGLVRYAQILDRDKPVSSGLKKLGRRVADFLRSHRLLSIF